MAEIAPADVVRLLEELSATCRDGEEGFRQAAADFDDPALRARFLRYAHGRAGLASELLGEIQRLGGEPDPAGHVAGAIHRGWMRFKAAVTGHDDSAILAEAERGEDVAVDIYRKAMERDLPIESRTILQRQLDDIEQVHREVRALRDAAAAGPET